MLSEVSQNSVLIDTLPPGGRYPIDPLWLVYCLQFSPLMIVFLERPSMNDLGIR